MLMSLQYRVTLPDHDFPVGTRHNLTPSVMAVIAIKEDQLGKPEAVTYSGPTYICVRSGKHASSTANTHADDFRRMVDLPEFQEFTKTPDGRVKPVVMMTVDGGPDECPRYKKNIAFAIDHFKNYELDAIFVACNAPGRSAFNRVERRMAPLSHRMSGVLLPHDYYGSHLNSRGETEDLELEKQNFKKAGEILVGLWSDMTIDDYPVHAVYIEPGESDLPPDVDPQWYHDHVRESQYLVQIMRCNSEECCGPPRSSLSTLLRGFLPPPVRVQQTATGLEVVPPSQEGGHFLPLFPRLASTFKVNAMGYRRVPYDLYCPSLHSKISGRVCKHCGIYFSSQENLQKHSGAVHSNQRGQPCSRLRPNSVIRRRGTEALCWVQYDHESRDAEWIEEDHIDLDILNNDVIESEDSPMPVVHSVGEWVSSPWTKDL